MDTGGCSAFARCRGLHADACACYHSSDSITDNAYTTESTTRNRCTYGLPPATNRYIGTVPTLAAVGYAFSGWLRAAANVYAVPIKYARAVTDAVAHSDSISDSDSMAIGYQHAVSDYCPGYPDGFD